MSEGIRAPPGARPAPVLARERDGIFLRRAQVNARRRVTARAAHVFEPLLVAAPHLLYEVGSLAGDVVDFERVVEHVVKFERGLGWRRRVRRSADRLDEFVALQTGGESTIQFRRVAAVPLKIERAIRPLDFVSMEQRPETSAVEGNVRR